MFSSNVLCITRTMASKKFLCFWNAFLIVILLFSSAMGSRDLSEIARPRMIRKSHLRAFLISWFFRMLRVFNSIIEAKSKDEFI